MSSDRNHIAIVGVACRFPGARDFDGYSRLLAEGRCAFEPVTREEAEHAYARGIDSTDPDWVGSCAPLADAEFFDAELFGYSVRSAQMMDPQQRVAMQCAYAALEDAAILPAAVDHAVGLYLASSPSTFLLEYLSAPELRKSLGVDALSLVNHGDFLATAISYRLDLRGPSMGIQTACSGSLVAVHSACEALRSGLCDLALAGGVSVRMPQRAGYLAPLGGVASRSGACRPFSEDADGTVFGSGAGIVVLQRLEDAIAHRSRILGVVVGSAVNNDGRARAGFTAPSQDGQAAVVAEAIAAAGLTPEDLMYVEAHGTGTRVGDDIELRALAEVFDGRRGPPLPIGSCKGNIGHADVAAGIAGLLKLLAAFRDDSIPATLGMGTCSIDDKVARSLSIVRHAQPWPASGSRRAGVSSFGIGGTNAHLVVEAPLAAEPLVSVDASTHKRDRDGTQLITVTAATADACAKRVRDLGLWLDGLQNPCLSDVAFTLHVGREYLPHRISVVAAEPRDASRVLRMATPIVAAARPAVLLLLPDRDPRAVATAQALRETFPPFREHFVRVAGQILCAGGPDLLLCRENTTTVRGDSSFASLALSLALADTLVDLGLAPEAFTGEGYGEWAAAILAGLVDRETGIAAVCRALSTATQRSGSSTIGVALSAAALAPLLNSETTIVGIATRVSAVVTGPCNAINALCTRLDQMSIPWEVTPLGEAWGTLPSPVWPIHERPGGGGAIAGWLSPSLGRMLNAGEYAGAEFWSSSGVRPVDRVMLADMLGQHLRDRPDRVAVDIGPTGTLATAIKSLGGEDLHVWKAPTSLSEPKAWVLALIGALHSAGAPLRLESLYSNSVRARVGLPAYPFARTGTLPPRDAAPPLAKAPAASITMRVPAWCRGERYVSSSHLPMRERWLALIRDAEDPVVGALRQRGADVITVLAGEAFERNGPTAFVARPRQAVDLAAVVATGGFTRVLHRWSTGAGGENERERGVIGAIHLLRALAATPRREDLRVFFSTERALSPDGSGAVIPARAALGALARVAGQEIPGLWSALIDSANSSALEVLEALCGESPVSIVALRDGRPLLPVYAPVIPTLGGSSLLVRGGVYVIIGGTGRFGRMIGQHLVDFHGATVVAASRRAGENHTDLNPWRVDIGDREAVFGLFYGVREQYGRIDGVIFAAGEAPDETHRTIVELGDDEITLLFDQRVTGFMNVHDALLDLDVPLKLLTSSMSPILGGLGLGAYGSAHTWIDAVADASHDWRAIHWEGWHRDSTPLSGYAGSAAHAQSTRMLSDGELCAAFDAAMHARIPKRIVVTREDLERRLAEWLPCAPAGMPIVAEYATTAVDVRAELRQILTSLLGEELGDDDDFFEMGGNSLVAVQLLARLRSVLGLDVPLRLLFEQPTVARLSAAIEAIRSDTVDIPREQSAARAAL